MSDVPGMTPLVNAAFAGDDDAVHEVWSLVYDELHSMSQKMRDGKWSGAAADTMHATVMVHELFIKMHQSVPTHWDSRAHFFGACANALEQLLIDHHRASRRLKRGGDRRRLPMSTVRETLAASDVPPADGETDDELALHLIEAIQELEQLDARRAAVARMRCVVGLSNLEIATALEVTSRTVQSDWNFARAWLHRRLAKDTTHDGA